MTKPNQHSPHNSLSKNEVIRKQHNSVAKEMQAKDARASIAARQKAERDARQRAAIEKIPLEHRYVPKRAASY